MSSANRGRQRHADDAYFTPYSLVEAMIPRIKYLLRDVAKPRIWEPCAGDGRITRVLKHFFPDALIYSTDITYSPGIDHVIDFLKAGNGDGEISYDLIISNPPFVLAMEIIQHAQTLVNEKGSVIMLERINFIGSKKRAAWMSWDPPNTNISPRRASFLATGQMDSVEYSWMEWSSKQASDHSPKEFGEMRILPTMMCWGCKEVHYEKTCASCRYDYCKVCYKDHEALDCKRNLFGKDSLWYCHEHPDRPMTNACRAKGCSLPFCDECWAAHASGKWRACQVTETNA